ncbi:MAG TPA: hypothetical protein VGX71_12910 [Pseudaminobacter sp.]|nr:hypothetical protein [Pseudaminobacter sp.]
MWKAVLTATIVYAYGHPCFDGYRPAALDAPLQAFHVEVNQSARDGQRVLARLDDARAMRYLKGYIEQMDQQLRSSD